MESNVQKNLSKRNRFGILPLHIESETGRYRGEPVHDRKCVYCTQLVLKMNFTFVVLFFYMMITTILHLTFQTEIVMILITCIAMTHKNLSF